MKNNLVSIIGIIVIGVIIILLFRFDVDVHSPVVCKTDRLTGKVWIVNGGVWRLIVGEDAPAAAPQSMRQK